MFRKLAKHEADAAHKENREFDMVKLCGQLAKTLLGPEEGSKFSASDILTDAGRKAYYWQLAEAYPAVFTRNIKPEKRQEALSCIRQDIEASELGPDIVIAVAIEKTYGQLEAARYLFALATGMTMRKGLLAP